MGSQMLRGVYPERSAWAQHDNAGFGRYSSLSAPAASLFRFHHLLRLVACLQL